MLRNLVQKLHYRLEQIVYLKFRRILKHNNRLCHKVGNALVEQLGRAIYCRFEIYQYRVYKICVVGSQFVCALRNVRDDILLEFLHQQREN